MKHQRNFRGENNVAARLSLDTKKIELEREFALWKLALGSDEVAKMASSTPLNINHNSQNIYD